MSRDPFMGGYHSQSRPLYGEKSIRGHENNMSKKNMILIDVDADYYDNVIIIDVPDSVPKKFRGPNGHGKGKAQVFTNVINIDDEDDDEMHDDKQSCDGVKKSSTRAEASTSRNFSRAGDGGDGATDEGPRVQENVTPVRLSKCKRTYSGKGFATNHYGLDTDSEAEGDASDSDDFPDCEVMVDSSGRVQKQWEKAFFKRWKDTNKGDSGAGKNCSTSKGIDENQDQQNGTDGETRRAKKSPFSSSMNKSETSNGYKSPTSAMNVDTEADTCPQSDLRDKDSPFVHTELNEKNNETESSKKNMYAGQKNTASLNPSHQEQSEADEVRRTASTFTDTTTSTCKVSTTGLKTASPDLKATTAPAFTGTTPTSTATPSFTTTATFASTSTATHCTGATLRKCQKPTESVGGSGSSSLKDDSLKSSRKGTTRTNNKNNSFNKPGVSEIPSTDHIPLNEADLRQDGELQSSDTVGGGDESCHNEHESRVISEREKLKETDEYKKAMDEEWASRKKALQIQAEEAQRLKQLRKRKKADSQRLSDIKKRQNKRLEEIRTSQKKDEENMNLKETIRAEVRKDLQKLELSCKNMASLLHSLGVSVTGWPNPLPQEVQTAYKKSLLTFHPDRALRFDIRQQVEAEEKFKLVNRLKEKFAPSL